MPKFQTKLADKLKSHKNNIKGWILSNLKKKANFWLNLMSDSSVYTEHKDAVAYESKCV